MFWKVGLSEVRGVFTICYSEIAQHEVEVSMSRTLTATQTVAL